MVRGATGINKNQNEERRRKRADLMNTSLATLTKEEGDKTQSLTRFLIMISKWLVPTEEACGFTEHQERCPPKKTKSVSLSLSLSSFLKGERQMNSTVTKIILEKHLIILITATAKQPLTLLWLML